MREVQILSAEMDVWRRTYLIQPKLQTQKLSPRGKKGVGVVNVKIERLLAPHVNSSGARNRGCRGGLISQKLLGVPNSMRMQQPSPPSSPPSILLLEFGKIPPDLIKSGELEKLVNGRDDGRGPLPFVVMWRRPSTGQIDCQRAGDEHAMLHGIKLIGTATANTFTSTLRDLILRQDPGGWFYLYTLNDTSAPKHITLRNQHTKAFL